MKALVLAGGFPQIALIKELHKRNIYVVLADYNVEPVAKKYCDKYYQVSTLDVEAIENVAVSEKINFLITACTDQALQTVAYVSERLGLPCYIDSATGMSVTNKAYMKEVFKKYSITTAKSYVMGELDLDKLKDIHYPLIVKPVDCNSSKGVKKVTNQAELEVAFEQAVGFSRTNTAIVEEFIVGPELSVDVYVEDGTAHILSVSNSEKIADKEKFVIFRSVYPAKMDSGLLEKIRITAQKIADAFNLKNSPMLIQMISDGKYAYVLEFSARTGGGVKYLLINRVHGFDVIKAVVDLTLGEKPRVNAAKPIAKYIVNEFIYCKPGIYDHLEGFNELTKRGVLLDYYPFKWRGADFGEINSSGDRVAGFTIIADSEEELNEKHRIAVAELKVIDAEGNDIMRRDLLPDISFE